MQDLYFGIQDISCPQVAISFNIGFKLRPRWVMEYATRGGIRHLKRISGMHLWQ